MKTTSTLTLNTFNAGTSAIFPVASTLISGNTEAILVDTQFQKQYAEQVVELIKANNKTLKYIYISHSDPDYYFGAQVIQAAFPQAKLVSTAQTAYLISASKDEKLAVWKDQLKDDAPTELLVPEAISGSLNIDGESIEIKQDPVDPAHSYLWIPSLTTILGGVSVSTGGHVWMADTQSKDAVAAWLNKIQQIKALNPSQVIPSHFVQADFSVKNLDFMQNYVSHYQQAINAHANADSIVAEMEQAYPDLAGKDSLIMGAKVFVGDIPWALKSPYPAIEKVLQVDFGAFKFDLTLKTTTV